MPGPELRDELLVLRASQKVPPVLHLRTWHLRTVHGSNHFDVKEASLCQAPGCTLSQEARMLQPLPMLDEHPLGHGYLGKHLLLFL